MTLLMKERTQRNQAGTVLDVSAQLATFTVLEGSVYASREEKQSLILHSTECCEESQLARQYMSPDMEGEGANQTLSD